MAAINNAIITSLLKSFFLTFQMDYEFAEFLARGLGVTDYQSAFYQRLLQFAPFVDIDITEFDIRRVVRGCEEQRLREMGMELYRQEQCLVIDRPSLSFYLHKRLPFETVRDFVDPGIFGDIRPEPRSSIPESGPTYFKSDDIIPRAGLFVMTRGYELDMVFPDASAVRLLICWENEGRDREQVEMQHPIEPSIKVHG